MRNPTKLVVWRDFGDEHIVTSAARDRITIEINSRTKTPCHENIPLRTGYHCVPDSSACAADLSGPNMPAIGGEFTDEHILAALAGESATPQIQIAVEHASDNDI